MVKMVEVTKAGGAYLDDEIDVKISINADNINICQPVPEEDVGITRIIFNDGTNLHVIETQEQLRGICNR
jgi:hypothetical protein